MPRTDPLKLREYKRYELKSNLLNAIEYLRATKGGDSGA